MNPRPIIFLDLDGVLCTARSHAAAMNFNGVMENLDPVGINMINAMCIASDAQIVVSSSWRLIHPDLPMTLRIAGLTGNIHPAWRTPDAFDLNTNHTKRGHDVQQWLDSNKNPEYIILDDASDFLEDQMDRLVQTDYHNGISINNFERAMFLLTGTSDYRRILRSKLPLGVRPS